MESRPQENAAALSRECKYIAFISYSHRGDTPLAARLRQTLPYSTLGCRADMRWAVWLQKQLETYRLPSTISRNLEQNKIKRIKPVFRDEDELGVGKLTTELQKNLADSRFLIVLCSPNSAKPNADGINYIDDEARYFIKRYGAENVIPVIIDGVPGGGDRECFPPVIREEGLLAIDATKLGRAHALSSIIAKILGLRPDDLWQREKRRRSLRLAMRTAASLLILACLAFAGYVVWDEKIPHVEYYADYTDRYGIPAGLFSLSDAEIRARETHYQFIYLGREKLFGDRILQAVRCCNSGGGFREDPISKKYLARPILQRLTYNQQYKLEYIDILSAQGRLQERRMFSGKKQTCIDFKTADKEGVSMGMFQRASGIGFKAQKTLEEDKAQIKRWRIRRDEQGRPVEIRFCQDDLDTPGRNADGYFGESYELDGKGRRIRKYFLGSEGEKIVQKDGTASIRYLYDPDQSGLLGVERLDRKGVVLRKTIFRRNRHQNITAVEHYLAGRPTWDRDGFAKAIYRYDTRGNRIEEAYFDPEGKPCLTADHLAAKITVKYDAMGNPIETAFFDTYGKPCLSREGAAKIITKYNSQNNPIETSYFGIDGKPCRNKDGIARKTQHHDVRENMLTEAYFGIDGKSCLSKTGVAGKKTKYDTMGNPVEAAFFGVDGKLCRGENRIARARAKYNNRGDLLEMACFGADGKPCLSKDGFARMTAKYDIRGNLVEEAYFGVDGKPCLNQEGYAKAVRKYDDRGNRTEVALFGVDGKPILNKEGLAKVTVRYDEKGNPVEMGVFGAGDKPGTLQNVKANTKYDDHGNPIEMQTFGIDGKPCLNEDGFAKVTQKYNDKGELIEEAFFGIDGKPCLNKNGFAKKAQMYNERGKLCEQAFFGADGKPCMSRNGFARTTRKYNAEGDLIEQTYFGVDGNLCRHKDGHAQIKYKYDAKRHLIETQSFDVDGKLIDIGKIDTDGHLASAVQFAPDGKSHTVTHFDRQLRKTQVARFGADGKQTDIGKFDTDGHLASTVQFAPDGKSHTVTHFDRQLRKTQVAYFGADGKPCLNKDGFTKITIKYDDRGNRIEQAYFGMDGKPVNIGKFDTDGHLASTVQFDQTDRSYDVTEFNLRQQPIKTVHFGADGKPCLNKDGFAKETMKYDFPGRLTEAAFWSVDGKPCMHKNGFAKVTIQYDAQGRSSAKYWDEKGNPVMPKSR